MILQFKNCIGQVKSEELSLADEGKTFDVDFAGHYLVQLEKKDDSLVATGKAMNGYGEAISLEPEEVIIVSVLDE